MIDFKSIFFQMKGEEILNPLIHFGSVFCDTPEVYKGIFTNLDITAGII